MLGFVGAGLLFRIAHGVIRDPTLFEPARPNEPPSLWVRCLLILTCSGVSLAHGSNDGQKTIGLIMLTVIGIMPTAFALNFAVPAGDLPRVIQAARDAVPLIAAHGDDEAAKAQRDADAIRQRVASVGSLSEVPAPDRPGLRDAVYHVSAELKRISERKDASPQDRQSARRLHDTLSAAVEYAPVWIRVLSALCLGSGTMIGYRRVVTTLGERIGKGRLTPGQGASAELIGALLIGSAGLSGLPVSTTHVVSSGVAGTMAASGAGVQGPMMWQIAIAWVATLPATIVLSGGLFWLLAGS